MEVLDIHHHLGALNGGSLQEGDGWQDRDYANRVRIMDANGVSAAAILARSQAISDRLRHRRAAARRPLPRRVGAHEA